MRGIAEDHEAEREVESVHTFPEVAEGLVAAHSEGGRITTEEIVTGLEVLLEILATASSQHHIVASYIFRLQRC